MNLYPIYYKNTPILIFALSLTDAKIPYDRVSMKSYPLSEFKDLLTQAKDTPLEQCKLILSGPNISYKEILQAQKNLLTFARHTSHVHTEPPIKVSEDLQNAFEELPEEPIIQVPEVKEPPKESITITDDLAGLFDEINTTSKEINVPDIFG